MNKTDENKAALNRYVLKFLLKVLTYCVMHIHCMQSTLVSMDILTVPTVTTTYILLSLYFLTNVLIVSCFG